MTVYVSFKVAPGTQLAQCGGSHIFTEDNALIDELAALGHEFNSYSRYVTIQEEEGAPRLLEALEIVERALGLRRAECRFVPVAQRDRFFAPKVFRKYTAADISAAPWLFVSCSGAIATLHDQLPDESCMIKVDEHYRLSKLDIGSLRHSHLACTEKGRAQLEGTALKGVQFRPIQIIPAEKAQRPLWEVYSSVTGPACEYKIVNNAGVVFNGDWTLPHAGGYLDNEHTGGGGFRYQRKALEALGDFDVAQSPERWGLPWRRSSRWFLVSQRFRAAMKQIGYKLMRYTPLDLV